MTRLTRTLPLCVIMFAAGPVFAQTPPTLAATSTTADTSKPAPLAVPPGAVAASSDHRAYTAKAEGDVKGWEAKLHAFNDRAKAKGTAAAGAAKDELDAAWTHVRAATNGLENAADDGWDAARSSYESASSHLASAWQAAQREL